MRKQPGFFRILVLSIPASLCFITSRMGMTGHDFYFYIHNLSDSVQILKHGSMFKPACAMHAVCW